MTDAATIERETLLYVDSVHRNRGPVYVDLFAGPMISTAVRAIARIWAKRLGEVI